MPLYFVRRLHRDPALIAAKDLDSLHEYLDAPDQCASDVYEGPFYLDRSPSIIWMDDDTIEAMRHPAPGSKPIPLNFSDPEPDGDLEQDIGYVLAITRNEWPHPLGTDGWRNLLRGGPLGEDEYE